MVSAKVADKLDSPTDGCRLFRIRLLGFAVEIQLTFLILAVFVINRGLSGAGVALWVLGAFVSVLVHELGHAVTARAFGGQVVGITIHALGGVTMWQERRPMSGFKRFLVAASGSGTGFIVAGILFGLVKAGVFGTLAERLIASPWRIFLLDLDRLGLWGLFFLGTFIWASFIWGAINWLPIGGLDGSKMLSELLIRFLGPRGAFHAAVIGVIAAVVAALWFFQRGFVFAPVLFLLFAFNDFNQARQAPR